MVQFDERGNLFPYALTEIELSKFKDTFVKNFPQSHTRPVLFDNYLQYLNDLSTVLMGGSAKSTVYIVRQWIDGSFISRKTNPNDLDLLIFLDYHLHEVKEKQLNSFRGPLLKQTKGIDAYFIKVFPESHPDYLITQFNMADWMEIFGYTRRDKHYRRHPKGIIQLNFEPK